MIKLLKGSIFDSKCDLIIIPCNDYGGVSASIHGGLMVNNLPYFHNPIEPGDIRFIESIDGFTNANSICYAASVVANNGSSTELVQSLMKKIKKVCRSHSLYNVNMPLLGTGAGQLSPISCYDIIESEFKNDEEILINVFVFTDQAYKMLSDQYIFNEKIIRNPRVFISYSSFNLKIKNWVKDFAIKLRACGVDARLDRFHLKPGQDLPQWMTNELIMADKVIMICDKFYAEKADNRKGGVGWETMIIQGDMLGNQSNNKYAVILKDEDIDQSLPIYVKSKYAIDWSNEEKENNGFDELLLYLFDCDIAPPIGEIPVFIKEKLIS